MKKLITIILAVALAAMMSFSFGCGAKISTVTLNVRLYTASTTYDTYQIKLSLYEHLAPETAAEFKEWAKDGVYDGMAFYLTDAHSSQVMVGDLKWDGANLNLVQPQTFADAEFDANGTTGSNLENVSGAFGLWREFDREAGYQSDGFKKTVSTIYMPTSTISAYNGYFCVLGNYSDDADSVTAMTAIKNALNGDEIETYVRFQLKDDSTVLFMTEEDYDAISVDRIDEDSVEKITVPAFACYIESVEC